MTRNKIISAAIGNLAKYGYHGATMGKIAKETGIKPASIYYFFTNKEELFGEAVQLILDHHFQCMEQTYNNNQGASLHTILSELLNAIVVHHTANRKETDAYIAMVSAPVPIIKQKISTHAAGYKHWLMENLRETIGDEFPALNKEKINDMIHYFIFMGNGLFWSIGIANEHAEIERSLQHAQAGMKQYLESVIGGKQHDRQ